MATRKQHSRKTYVYEDGSEGRSAKPDWVELRFEFLTPEKDAKGNYGVVDTFTVKRDDVPLSMFACAAGHGLSQKLGDSMAGLEKKAEAAAKDGETFTYDDERGWADLMEALLTAQWENIENGVWVEEGEGSSGTASVSILLEAIMAAYEKADQPLDDTQVASMREKLKDENKRKAFKANTHINAEYLRIQKERADARAAKAAEKAKESGTEDLASLLD